MCCAFKTANTCEIFWDTGRGHGGGHRGGDARKQTPGSLSQGKKIPTHILLAMFDNEGYKPIQTGFFFAFDFTWKTAGLKKTQGMESHKKRDETGYDFLHTTQAKLFTSDIVWTFHWAWKKYSSMSIKKGKSSFLWTMAKYIFCVSAKFWSPLFSINNLLPTTDIRFPKKSWEWYF